MIKYVFDLFRRGNLLSGAGVVNLCYLVVTFVIPICLSSFLIMHFHKRIGEIERVNLWVDYVLSFQPNLKIVPNGIADPSFVKFYHVMMISSIPLISIFSWVCVLLFGRDFFVGVAREVGSKIKIIGWIVLWVFAVCGIIFLPQSYGIGRGDLLYESCEVMLLFGWIPYVAFLFLNSAFFAVFVSLFFSCGVKFIKSKV